MPSPASIKECVMVPRDGEMTKEEREEKNRLWQEAVERGIERWLDKKFTQFGKWSAATLAVLFLGALAYFTLKANGWTKIVP